MSEQRIETVQIPQAQTPTQPERRKLKITSGTIEFTSTAQVQTRIMSDINNAAAKAISRTIEIVFPSIAFDTGRLRAAFLNMLNDLNAIIIDEGELRINLDFARMLLFADYAFEHIGGRPRHKGEYFYEHPTTQGTIPINPETIMIILEQQIFLAISTEFSRSGFQYIMR